MTTAREPIRPLPPTNVVAIHQPINLGNLLTAARNGLDGRALARLLDAWLDGAGNARTAVETASAAELGDVVRDYSSHCEECRAPLPAWVESVDSDVPLHYCPGCAVVDQAANPQDWREYMADASAAVMGHDS